MENDLSVLTGLGFSPQEAACYGALLKLGPSGASLVAKVTGFQRTAVYPILKGMAERGIVNVYEKRGKRLYQAQRPERVAGYYERKLKNFEEAIPALRQLAKATQGVIGLRFLETKKELKAFYRDILEEYSHKQKKDRTYRVLGSTPDWQGVDAEFLISYRRERAKAGIHTSLLLTDSSRKINPTEPDLLRTYKFLPKQYEFKSTIDIFDDKILIVNPDPTALAVVIEVPAMVDVFKAFFDLVWETTPAEKI